MEETCNTCNLCILSSPKFRRRILRHCHLLAVQQGGLFVLPSSTTINARITPACSFSWTSSASDSCWPSLYRFSPVQPITARCTARNKQRPSPRTFKTCGGAAAEGMDKYDVVHSPDMLDDVGVVSMCIVGMPGEVLESDDGNDNGLAFTAASA